MLHHTIAVLIILFLASVTHAHGTDQHVLGTVIAIDENHMEIRTTKGETVSVQINKQTRFKAKRAPESTEPPAVGDRVVVEATKDEKDNKTLTATEVHYASAKRVPPIEPTPAQQAPEQATVQ